MTPSPARSFSRALLCTATLAAASLPALSAPPKVSIKARELQVSVLENDSWEPVTLTVKDLVPIGHTLVIDLETRGLLADLSSRGDSFTLEAPGLAPSKGSMKLSSANEVGLIFIPTAKTVSMTYELRVGDQKTDVMSFSVKKSCNGLFGDANVKVNTPSNKVQFNKGNFEKGKDMPVWICRD